MALPVQNVVCTECRTPMEAQPKRSFLGFRKFQCTSCRKVFLYPLTTGYWILYLVAIILFGCLSVALLLAGKVALPGILVIAGVVAMVKNAMIKQKVAKTEKPSEPR